MAEILKRPTRVYAFSELRTADLIVDALYEGGSMRNVRDDPLDPVLRVGNQGGFRAVGAATKEKLAVLYSTLDDPDWPDYLDLYSGLFTYHGDNKKPGHELHDTARGGNALLRRCFADLHSGNRSAIPPFFVFTKGGKGRDVVFRGVAVPGDEGRIEDLVAIWKSSNGLRFQNYRAVFTILDASHISRTWIDDLHRGEPQTLNAPESWLRWVRTGTYLPLRAEPTIRFRSPEQQRNLTANGRVLIERLYSYFGHDPYAFEACAAEIIRLMDSRMVVFGDHSKVS